MIEFDVGCPHCSQDLQATEEMLGQTIECPACQGQMTLPKLDLARLKRSLPPGLPGGGRMEGLAVASLVVGLCAPVLGPFGLLAGIVAITCGQLASRRILRSKGALRGHGIATVGRILGFLAILLSLAMIPMCASMMDYWW